MLPGCLQSLEGQVGRIVVVDGRYQQFPGRGAASTDTTVAVARAFGAEVIRPPGRMCYGGWHCRRAWRSQMEKRSAYLVGEEGDRYLRIDADERLVGSLDGLQAGVDYAMRVKWAGGPQQPWVACLFEQRGQMRYAGAHCALWREGEIISRRRECTQWDDAFLLHLKMERSAARQAAKKTYYAWQTPAERAFRREHNV